LTEVTVEGVTYENRRQGVKVSFGGFGFFENLSGLLISDLFVLLGMI